MKVEFRFTDGKAQIVLEPSNSIDQANLANVIALKGNAIDISAGPRRDLVIECRVETKTDFTSGFVPSSKE
jgi:hypothetical protein